MDISFNTNFHESFMYYQRNLRDYGDNFHEYNQNMTAYLTMMSYHATTTNIPNRHPIRNSHRNTLNSVWSNYIHRRDRDNYNYDNVIVVRPSQEQIENATENIEITNELAQNTCPITLESFQEGEQVCRIIHCGHIFKTTGINIWFERNTHCPVCRYDIRHFVRQDNSLEETEFDEVIRELNEELNEELNGTRTQSTPSTSANSSSTVPLSTPFTNILSNAVRSFINSELQHLPENNPFNELIYTFDIPIDISGGRYRI